MELNMKGALITGRREFSLSNSIYTLVFFVFVFAVATISVVLFGEELDSALLGGIYLLVVLALGLVVGIVDRKSAIFLLLILLASHTLLIMLLSNYVDKTIFLALLGTKDIFAIGVLISFVINYFNKVKYTLTDLASVFFLLIYIIYFIAPLGGSILSKIVSLREGLMIVLFYWLGRFGLGKSDYDLQFYLLFVIKLAFVVSVFGLIERIFFTNEIWMSLGAQEYFNKKFGGALFSYFTIDGLPAHWYSYIGENYYRRLVGTVGDATSLSRFLSLPVLILLIYNINLLIKGKLDYRVVFLLALTASAMILTIGRGGVLIVVIGLGIYLFRVTKPLFFIFLALLIILITPMIEYNYGNLVRHLTGLYGGFDVMSQYPLGIGLGTTGQMAAVYSSVDVKFHVLESYIGALSSQLGFLGLFSYVSFFLLAVISMLRSSNMNPTKNSMIYATLGVASVVGIFLTSLLAQSAVSPISMGIQMIFVGGLMSNISRGRSVLNSKCV